MGYDEIIPLLGNFGRYQKTICFLVCLPSILCAFHQLSNTFSHARAEHRCQLDEEPGNAEFNLPTDILNGSFPYDPVKEEYSSCSLLQNGSEVSCSSYIYNNSKHTIPMEWNLVCNEAFLPAMADSIFMLGVLFGSIVFGYLSDKYGRRLIFLVALAIQFVFGMLVAIAPTFWLYVVFRFIVGSTTSGGFLAAYIIAMEMVSPNHRITAGIICQMFYSVGYILTALFAYLVYDWRILQVVLSIPGVLFLSYRWIIPESIRWLVMKGRLDEAKQLARKAARVNKLQIQDDEVHKLLIEDSLSEAVEDTVTILKIYKYPNLRKRSAVVLFDWMVNAMSYYGLSWNTNNLGGNVYVNFAISGILEIPAYTFLLLTLNKWGRKLLLCSCMIIGGIALLLTMAVPQDYPWALVVLSMAGKLAITASYCTVYIFSTEQFPTVVRNAALGAGYTFAMIGSMMAPFINLLGDVWTPFPMIVFGLLALLAGFLSLILPETLNHKLPETLEDAEDFGCLLNVTAEEN